MNLYHLKDIQNYITPKFGSHFQITPIGNHHLERNAVYLLEHLDQKLVFKLYKKPLRAIRERFCLNLLEESSLSLPQIIDYGEEETFHWLLESYVEGVPFSQVESSLSPKESYHIYEEFGIFLSSIHNFSCFEGFGAFVGQPLSHVFPSFSEAFSSRLKSIEETILQSSPTHKSLLLEGIATLKEHIYLLNSVTTPTLCHNDYDGRNILVKETDGKFHVSGLIDFEQSIPWDQSYDFISLYLKVFVQNNSLEKAFWTGYNIQEKDKIAFEEKKNFYLLYQGVMIGSFAEQTAPGYYDFGVSLVKKYHQKNTLLPI